MPMWSNTEQPYQCLLDFRRTTALQTAILGVIQPGDTVVDLGAGTGILSFFAAKAGAAQVLAVEADPYLVQCLQRSCQANHFTDVIEILQADACDVSLPSAVDVVICEMVETGLLDELQVMVMNHLHQQGVIGPQTTLIPCGYETFIELGFSQFEYYGFTLLAPKHDWPDFTGSTDGWLPSQFQPHSPRIRIQHLTFEHPVDPLVHCQIDLTLVSSGLINAVRLSGVAHLAPGLSLGMTNALNGDKVIPIPEYRGKAGQRLAVQIQYEMSAGLESLQVKILDP